MLSGGISKDKKQYRKTGGWSNNKYIIQSQATVGIFNFIIIFFDGLLKIKQPCMGTVSKLSNEMTS